MFVILTNFPRLFDVTVLKDLKDLMRKAGEVVFTDIAEDGSGYVCPYSVSTLMLTFKHLALLNSLILRK